MPKTQEPKNNQPPDAAAAEKKRKSDSTGVRLDEDVRKDVERICAQEGIPFSTLVQDAIKSFIGNPARQHGQVLRSMAITREQIERGKAAGFVPVEAADELLEKLEEVEQSVRDQKPAPKRKPFRFRPPLVLLSLGEDDKE